MIHIEQRLEIVLDPMGNIDSIHMSEVDEKFRQFIFERNSARVLRWKRENGTITFRENLLCKFSLLRQNIAKKATIIYEEQVKNIAPKNPVENSELNTSDCSEKSVFSVLEYPDLTLKPHDL